MRDLEPAQDFSRWNGASQLRRYGLPPHGESVSIVPIQQVLFVYRRTRIGQRVDDNQAAGLTANA